RGFGFVRNSALSNAGTLKNSTGGSLFVKSSSVSNTGSIVVNAAGAINFDQPITNSAGGQISLLGGVMAAPSVTNSVGGTVNGFGQITGNFINSGSTTFLGPTQIVGNFTNNAGATVAVRNAQTLVTGLSTNNGSITTSNGTIVFDGGILAPSLGGVDGSGALLVNAGGHFITSYVRQQSLVVGGVSGNPGFANLRSRADGGDLSI